MNKQTKAIFIIGAGGNASVAYDCCQSNGFEVSGFIVESRNEENQSYHGIPIISEDFFFDNFTPEAAILINAIGSIGLPIVREKAYQLFRSRGYSFETLIHPDAVVSKSAKLMDGVLVYAGAIIQTNAEINENVLINTRSVVEHDSVVGAHSHVATGAIICGDSKMGEFSHLGAGGTVIQGIKLAKKTVVAAGATVVRDQSVSGFILKGTPARSFKL